MATKATTKPMSYDLPAHNWRPILKLIDVCEKNNIKWEDQVRDWEFSADLALKLIDVCKKNNIKWEED